MSLYRGAGGASDATDDSTVNAVAGYASAAAASATAANADATLASNSASASAASATAAASSASTAFTYSNNASSAANAANTRATAALNSANAAAASATSASASAGSASSASSQASAASNSANTYKNSAATSATAAAASATAAANSVAEAMAIFGDFDTLNNYVGLAETSALEASLSASAAASSASNAASRVTEANAAVASASSYADSAQASANSSQAYATSALAARDATLAAYDSFDDRYLGVKSSNPTVDNDGNPLIAGSLYFNDQTNMMMLYAGGNWVAAYTSGGSPSFGNTVVNGTLQVTGNTTLSGGTANGVAYLNGSKVLTTGSALTFDGTNALSLGSSGSASQATVLYLKGTDNSASGSAIVGQRNGVSAWLVGDTAAAIGSGTGLISYAYGSSPFIWHTQSNGELMRLTSTGLGIGTSSPSYKLEVVGAANTFASVGSTGASSGRAMLFLDKKGTPTKYNWLAGAQYNIDNGFEITPSTAVGGTTFSTPAFVVQQSGNVGIGTTSPENIGGSYKTLQVGGSSTSLGVIQSYDGTTKAAIYTANDGNGYFGTRTSHPVLFIINSTVKATLDTSGNLGLGVTPSNLYTPGKVLQIVSGGATLYGSATTAALLNNVNFDASGNSLYQLTQAASYYRQSVGTHIWYNAPSGTAGTSISWTQAMALDASGNLAIGAPSPSARLDVNSGATSTSAWMVSTATTAYSPTTSASVTNARLHLYGGNATGSYTAIRFSQGASFEALFGAVQNSAGTADFIWQGYSGSAYAERMRLDSSGNLLVGLTSATGSAKLQVSGPIRTTGYTVATLPTGTVGMRTYVTDALAPTFGSTVVGGGAVTIPVFYNGTNWIVA